MKMREIEYSERIKLLGIRSDRGVVSKEARVLR